MANSKLKIKHITVALKEEIEAQTCHGSSQGGNQEQGNESETTFWVPGGRSVIMQTTKGLLNSTKTT